MDPDGETRFSEVELEAEPAEFRDGRLEQSTLLVMATAFEMVSLPAGWSGEWRATPQRRLVFVREGRLEVASSAGERRRFGPGQLLLIGDTAGRSHRLRNAGRAVCQLLVGQLG